MHRKAASATISITFSISTEICYEYHHQVFVRSSNNNNSDVQMSSLMATASGQEAGKPPAISHTRQSSGAGLLAYKDAYTPTATPGHSRPGSYLPEGSFMETMLAAAAAEAADSAADGAKTPPLMEPAAASARGPSMALSPMSRTDLLGIHEGSERAGEEDLKN